MEVDYIFACHLQIDPDPDPVNHFDADADPDPEHCLKGSVLICSVGTNTVTVTLTTNMQGITNVLWFNPNAQ